MSTYGQNALMIASIKGYKTVAKLLMQSGTNIAALDNNNCTAFDFASLNNHIELARYLRDAGNEFTTFKINPLSIKKIEQQGLYLNILYKNSVYYADIISLFNKYGKNQAFKRLA